MSQINAIITCPQTSRLDDPLKKSIRTTTLAVSPLKRCTMDINWLLLSKIPDLPEIESIVSRSPPQSVGRNDGHGGDLEATASEILQVQLMVKTLLEPSNDDELPLWQMLASVFGSLGSRFADIGWFIGAMRMSYHDVQIRCALANFQSYPTPADLSRSSIIPPAPPYHVELLDATAKLLHHRSLYSANQFCFNDARKASKEAIRIQYELCMHEPANVEFKLALSWMQRHFASFRRQDSAYNFIACRSVGNMVQIPPDVTKFDIARGFLRHGVQAVSGMMAIFSILAGRLIAAGAIYATGWAVGEYLSFINRRS